MTAIAFDTLVYLNVAAWALLWWRHRRERKRDERFAHNIARYTNQNRRRNRRR